MSKVSVIIPTYKDNKRLNTCLEALEEQTYPTDEFEVIIINNSVEDEVVLSQDYLLDIHIYEEESPGSYAARNKGIKKANNQLLAFTDSDCIPKQDWIEHGVKKLEKNDSQRVGGKVEFFFQNRTPNIYERIDATSSLNQEKYTQLGFGVTANLFVDKKVFDRCGLFDSSLMSGGDYEFSMRAQKKGFDIAYAPQAVIYHPARYTLKQLVEKNKRVALGQKELAKANKLLHNRLTWRRFLPTYKTLSDDIFDSLSIKDKIKSFFILNYLKFNSTFIRLFK